MDGPQRRDDGRNRWFLFRRTFTLSAAPADAPLTLACDGRYRVFVNGTAAGRGPVRGSANRLRSDRFDVAHLLRHGANALAVVVHSPGVDLAWYETQKGPCQQVFGDGGLYVDLDCREFRVVSDAAWRCVRTAAWRADVPRAGWGLGYVEDFDARAFPAGWTDVGFDDSEWQFARPLVAVGDADAAATGTGRLEPIAAVVPSGLSPLQEGDVAPSRVLGAWLVATHPALPVELQPWDQAFVSEAGPCVTNRDALLTPDTSAALVTTPPNADVVLIVEFDVNHAGRPFLEIDARGGEILDLLASERTLRECGPEAGVSHGLTRVGVHAPLPALRYHARAGVQTFERFDWTAVRTLQLVVRNAPLGVHIRHLGSRATRYPTTSAGAFACSDALLTDLWRIGRHTVQQCAQDGWVDCSGREQRQWVGDVAVTMDVGAVTFGPSLHALDRFFLETTAERQRPDGLLPMFAPGDGATEGVTIPDFTLHWVRLLARYFMLSGDEDALLRLWPHAQRALAWFADLESEAGLLTDVPHWHFIEWAHLRRDGESAPINALYVDALHAAAHISEQIGCVRLSERYRARAARVAAALNERHWDDDRGVYVDSVHPVTHARCDRVSQVTNALLILFDIAPRARWSRMLDRVAAPPRLKVTAAPPVVTQGQPFDERNDVVRANTFFAHFVYQALAKAGCIDLALDAMREHYGPMLRAGATTLWESYEPSASLCHGFSAGPVYTLSAYVLGATPMAPGLRRFEIRPCPGALTWARGAVPTARGPLEIEWSRDSESLTVDVCGPADVEWRFAVPAGHRLVEESPGRARYARLVDAGGDVQR